jgi:hypothetical protein
MIRHALLGAAAALAVGAASVPASAATQVGVLECRISGGVGLIITSSKSLNCLFRSNRGWTEHYVGSLRKFGFDIGATTGGQMVWGVFAPSNSRQGTLAGEYIGASADASLGAGVGANALIGGFGRSVSLQPLSIQAQVGVNLALGVSGLQLLWAPR